MSQPIDDGRETPKRLRAVDGRVPPNDLDAEGAVLSAILLEKGAIDRVLATLRADQFYSESNRRIYEACVELAETNVPIDIVHVAGQLRDRDRLAQVGGAAYLAQLVDSVPSVANLETYAARVVEKWRARQFIALGQRVAAEGYTNTPADALGRILENALDILQDAPTDIGTPCTDDPLRGLTKLAAVAIIGRKQIAELAERPVVYIWEGIALAGIIVVLAGGPGSGKTTLLFLILAARMNLGEPVKVLGRIVTPAPTGRFVVLIEAEHGEASSARKLTKSCRLLGIDESALDRVILVARRCVVVGSREWHEITKLVAAGLVSDIALDTLARVAPSDPNDEREQVAVFDQIARTIDAAPNDTEKPVAWIATHTRKGDGDGLASVSGSAQRTGQADTVLIVAAERRDGKVTSSTVTFWKLREEPDEYPAPVEYTVAAGQIVDADAPREADDRPLEERILERLALGAQTKSKLSTSLGCNKALIDTALDNLFAAKRITTTEVTVRGRPFKAFALRNHQPSFAHFDTVQNTVRVGTAYEQQ